LADAFAYFGALDKSTPEKYHKLGTEPRTAICLGKTINFRANFSIK
jgi:hypothetical protein